MQTLEQRVNHYCNEISRFQEQEFADDQTCRVWSAIKKAHLRTAEFAYRAAKDQLDNFYAAEAMANICLLHLSYLD